MKMRKISGFENAVYYLMCIVTLGAFWISRIIVTKAITIAFDKGNA